MATAKPGNEPRWSGSRDCTLIFFTAYEEDITHEQDLTHSVVAVEAKTNPTGSSRAGIALQGCPKFRQGGWACVSPHQPKVAPRDHQ